MKKRSPQSRLLEIDRKRLSRKINKNKQFKENILLSCISFMLLFFTIILLASIYFCGCGQDNCSPPEIFQNAEFNGCNSDCCFYDSPSAEYILCNSQDACRWVLTEININ